MNTQRKKIAWILTLLVVFSGLLPSAIVAQEVAEEVEEVEEVVTPEEEEATSEEEQTTVSKDAMVKLFNKASKSVGLVHIRDQDYRLLGQGSGFFVSDDGYFITNYHVIKGAAFVRVRMSDEDETEYICEKLAADPEHDLALLKLKVEGKVEFLPMAKDEFPPVATEVCAIGNPAGLTNTFSEGRVSGYRDHQKRKDIQITAPIAPGSSGGPLLNMDGEVVGVTTWARGTHLGFVGNLNFAVPVKYVRAFVKNPGKMREMGEGEAGKWFKDDTMSKLDKAREALQNRELAEAYSLLTKLQTEEKDNPYVYDALGDFYFILTRYKQAITYYQKALKINPKIVNSNFYLADCYAKLKMFEKAIDSFKKTLELKPYEVKIVERMAETYKDMGLANTDMGNYEEAIKAFGEAMSLKPNDFEMYYYEGEAYAQWKKYEKAIKSFQKFLAYRKTKYQQFGPEYNRGWVAHYGPKSLRAKRRIGEMHLQIRLAKTQ